MLSSTVFHPALNSSAGTSSGPVSLRLAVWRMARATSERNGGGTCSQYCCLIPFFSAWRYKSLEYPFYLSAICAVSVKFSPVAEWIHCTCGWNVRVIDLTIWKSCLEFSFDFAAFNFHTHAYELLLFSVYPLWAFCVPQPSVLDIGFCLCRLLPFFPWLLRKSHQNQISISFLRFDASHRFSGYLQ